MNLEQTPFQISAFSLRSLEDTAETTDIIFQKTEIFHKHKVPLGYLVLSKNDFGKVKKRINLGIFNKKTNFLIGEKNSLLVWDNEDKKIHAPLTSELIKNPSRYFLIYDLNFITFFRNFLITIEDKTTKEIVDIKLTRRFGHDIGEFLCKFDPAETELPEKFRILKSLIFLKEGRLSLNKQLLINSNIEFLLGILEGYLQKENKCILKPNINIYNFTYILNILGAQYSIRSLAKTSEKHVRFKLPIFLKNFSDLPGNFFRSYKYIFKKNDITNLKLEKNIQTIIPAPDKLDFVNLVNSGLIELVPIKDLVFIEVKDQIMYDFTMPNANATNFSFAGTPYMKNSDGDVLGVIALHTKDAAEECIRKFSTELKENFLNLSSGEVNNWGVKLDSQLGLYTATK